MCSKCYKVAVLHAKSEAGIQGCKVHVMSSSFDAKSFQKEQSRQGSTGRSTLTAGRLMKISAPRLSGRPLATSSGQHPCDLFCEPPHPLLCLVTANCKKLPAQTREKVYTLMFWLYS